MWKGEIIVLWNHIADKFYKDRKCGFHIIPKITYKYINILFNYEW